MVVVHSRHEEDTKRVAREISGDFCAADLSKPQEIDALFEHIRGNHGRLDILVNCVAHDPRSGLLDVSLEEWNHTMAVNLTACFLCTKYAGALMRDHGGGVIINISAASGERSSPGRAAYSVSKGAINALTKQAAVDLAPYGIRVNAIIAGIVGTPLGRRDMGNRKAGYDTIPLRRIGEPEEVAETAVFLASDRASYITNTIVPVDGGRMNSMGRVS